MRQTWGSDIRELIFLYKTVVEPVLLYGCSVLISSHKSAIKKIRSFQRSVAFLVICTFKTTPTLSRILLSTLRPVDVGAIEKAAVILSSTKHIINSLLILAVPSTKGYDGLRVV